MQFDDFCSKVKRMVKRADCKVDVKFCHEDGKHIARFSDGMSIIGNTLSKRVFVKWGSGHTAMAVL